MARMNSTTPTLHIGPDVEGDQRIVIHGMDITSHVRALTFDAKAGHLPRLVVELVIVDQTKVGAKHANVWMPEATAELLQRAGWTPPADRPAALLALAEPAREA